MLKRDDISGFIDRHKIPVYSGNSLIRDKCYAEFLLKCRTLNEITDFCNRGLGERAKFGQIDSFFALPIGEFD